MNINPIASHTRDTDVIQDTCPPVASAGNPDHCVNEKFTLLPGSFNLKDNCPDIDRGLHLRDSSWSV